MFTVKHITLQKEETLIEAEEVTLGIPEHPLTDIQRSVYVKASNGSFITIDSGLVYVMNANGKTVADYLLGNPYTREEVGVAATKKNS